MSDGLSHPDATIEIEPLADGRRRVRVTHADPRCFVATGTWETRYPDALLAAVLQTKGPAYFLDEVRRDEDPAYVADWLLGFLRHYEAPERLEAARICDFGCGSGASTMILARRFPRARIVGVDLSQRLLELARARRAFYQAANVEFVCSPDGNRPPPDIGEFDYVILSGVFEHLLPGERRELMPRVWELLRPGGLLFVGDTPHRYWPLESHTTGLPFINYLPDALAHRVSRRISPRLSGDESWDNLLRAGIRGATPAAVAQALAAGGGPVPHLLAPTAGGLADPVQLWLEISSRRRLGGVKRLLGRGLSLLHRRTGLTFVPTLDLAFRKPDQT